MECKGQGNIHVSCDVTGADAVNLNIVLAPFVTECFCELSESTLCSRVCGHGQPALECEERTKVYDFAALERHHMAACCLREKPHGFEVHIENLVYIISIVHLARIISG